MIKLYNDDCFKIMKQLKEENVKVDAIICDPPYVINYADWDKEFNMPLVIDLCERFTIQNWIVWDRIKGRGAKKNFVSTREDILWYCKGNNPTYNKIYSNIPKKTGGMGKKNGQECRALTNVWYDISPIVPWSSERNGHPTQKPLQLMERCVTIWTNEGDTILDFTMGSGTTGEACVNLRRNFIGIESDKQWFDVADKRINK